MTGFHKSAAAAAHLRRVERAKELVKTGILTQVNPGEWKVQSARSRKTWYRVIHRFLPGHVFFWNCTCLDHREGFICKHILAVEFMLMMKPLSQVNEERTQA